MDAARSFWTGRDLAGPGSPRCNHDIQLLRGLLRSELRSLDPPLRHRHLRSRRVSSLQRKTPLTTGLPVIGRQTQTSSP